jgi:16S rRNA (adenine1518-N6/adenine1519-N6)-dimethyltransferase
MSRLPAPAKKRFGQHFLHDPAIIARIIAAFAPQPGDTVVEIGPGAGALTGPLLGQLPHLHAIEVDRDMQAHLGRVFPAHRLTMHGVDVLDFDFSSLPRPFRVIGNLPYNISTPILFRLVEMADVLRDALFMLQREVVDRMVAAPATSAYGRLSVMLQARFAMRRVLRVPAGAFSPPPKVESAVVSLLPLPDPEPLTRAPIFARLVQAGFGQRRKTLANALDGVLAVEHIRAAGIDPGRRAETLSQAEFVALARASR